MHRVSTERAARDVRALEKATLSRRSRRSASRPRAPFRIVGEEVVVRQRGTAVLKLDIRTGRCVDVDPGKGHEEALRLVAPHALTLQGTHVLHASAVEVQGSLYAFTGGSGAGKTTLASMFAEFGARIESSDLLLLDMARRPSGMLGGEARISEWVASGGEGPLVAAEPGGGEWETRPLAAVFCIDAAPRRGSRFRPEALRGASAMAALLPNLFAEIPLPQVWTSVFDLANALARAGCVGTLGVPKGLTALRHAASRLVKPGAT
jgi:hypothetical protein